MKRLISIAALLACTMHGSVQAQSGTEPLLPVDSRIKILTYDEADVYTIITKYGYQTNIVFDKSEEIQTISVGDRSLWQIIPAGNRMFIRPMEEDVITNMTVLTNRRSYQFDLKSIGEDKTGNIYVAQFRYVDNRFREPVFEAVKETPPAPVETPAEKPAAPASSAPFVPVSPSVSVSPTNYNYTYSGADDLAPLQVYDDGKSTFIKYREGQQPLPGVFITDASGKETSVTTYVRDNMMVVDMVVPTLILRSSSGAVHVYNEKLNPGMTN